MVVMPVTTPDAIVTTKDPTFFGGGIPNATNEYPVILAALNLYRKFSSDTW